MFKPSPSAGFGVETLFLIVYFKKIIIISIKCQYINDSNLVDASNLV